MHQNRASPFASDFRRRLRYRREFRNWNQIFPFNRRENRRSLAILFAEEIAHLGCKDTKEYPCKSEGYQNQSFSSVLSGPFPPTIFPHFSPLFPLHWKATKAYLNQRGTKIRVFRVLFRALFLPPFSPHFSPLFPLQGVFTLPPLLPSSPPPFSPIF